MHAGLLGNLDLVVAERNDLIGQRRAFGYELVGTRPVPGITLDRAERADRLSKPPGIAEALVNLMAGLDELARSFEVSVAHLDDADAMKQDRATVLVCELLVQRQALLVEAPRRLELPRYARRAAIGPPRLRACRADGGSECA